MRYTAEQNKSFPMEWDVWDNQYTDDPKIFARFTEEDFEDGDAKRHAEKVAALLNDVDMYTKIPPPPDITHAPEQMTLRDKFAAKALQGFLSHDGGSWEVQEWDFEQFAEFSYELADEMMRVRQKGGEDEKG